MDKGKVVIKYCGSLYVVDNKERTLKFYKELFGFRMIQDFETNFTITGGVSFQTKDSWKNFINRDISEIKYGGNDGEIYIETEDLDAFVEKVNSFEGIQFVHLLQTHDWGQRGIRFYDPDMHIIEVSETLPSFCQRFYDEGLTIEEIAVKTGMSEKMIQQFLTK